MSMDREAIYSALFELLQQTPGFKSYSRRLKIWSEVAAAQMPALFLNQGSEVAETIRGMPTKWTFYCEIYIYVNVGSDQTKSPYIILNPLNDKVIKLFDAEDNTYGVQTLGGLVHSVKVNGKVENDGGALGQVAISIIPLEIIVAR